MESDSVFICDRICLDEESFAIGYCKTFDDAKECVRDHCDYHFGSGKNVHIPNIKLSPEGLEAFNKQLETVVSPGQYRHVDIEISVKTSNDVAWRITELPYWTPNEKD